MVESFYVGATLSDRALAARVGEGLTKVFGWQPTYRWYDVGPLERHEYPEIAAKEMKGVIDADVFIGLLPGRFGMAAELGAAIASKSRYRQKSVILWSADRKQFAEREDGLHPCIFFAHPDVERLVGVDPVLTVLNYLLGYPGVDRIIEYP